MKRATHDSAGAAAYRAARRWIAGARASIAAAETSTVDVERAAFWASACEELVRAAGQREIARGWRRGAGRTEVAMDRGCVLCDAPRGADESLCAACLADPEARVRFAAVIDAEERRQLLAAQLAAARRAIRLARVYREEAGPLFADADPRAQAALAQVAKYRETIRALRAGARADVDRPGLRKARPTPVATEATPPSRRARG